MKFPDYETWLKIVVNPEELAHMSKPNKHGYYKEKYEFALIWSMSRRPRWPRDVRPVIGEIGVRYGYSAASFCFALPNAIYHGWDLIGGGHGGLKGEKDSFPYVMEMLARNLPQVEVHLTHENSQLITSLDVQFDIFHVDGNHRCECTLHDMRLAFAALKPGGLMIVDDYTYIQGVHKAVGLFLEEENEKLLGYELIKEGFRGNALIWKKHE